MGWESEWVGWDPVGGVRSMGGVGSMGGVRSMGGWDPWVGSRGWKVTTLRFSVFPSTGGSVLISETWFRILFVALSNEVFFNSWLSWSSSKVGSREGK